EPAAWSEQLLDRTHRAVELLAENPCVELTSHEAVAVLAAVVASEFRDEPKHFVGDSTQRVDGSRLRQIHEWPDVQTAGRHTPLKACSELVSVEQLCEPSSVRAELCWIDGGV